MFFLYSDGIHGNIAVTQPRLMSGFISLTLPTTFLSLAFIFSLFTDTADDTYIHSSSNVRTVCFGGTVSGDCFTFM